jgi:parallel beta-helix repeat protein
MRTKTYQIVPGTEGQIIKVVSGKAAWAAETGGGGSTIQGTWKFSTTITDADPGSGNFRFNNATQPSATQIFISDDTDTGVNYRNLLLQLRPGDRIYIQKNTDQTFFHLVQVNGDPVGATNYVKLPITVEDSGTALANNDKCAFIILFDGAVRSSRILYDAVVATSGGDYTTVGAALAAGHSSIFIRAGTYAETGDLTLPSGGCLIAESPGAAILDFGAGAFSVRLDGTARSSSTGTYSLAQGSTAVVGVGTTFQTDLQAGDWIKVGVAWHEIASITDELNMVLSIAHQGQAIPAGTAVKAQSMNIGCCLDGIKIQNSTAQGIETLNTLDMRIDRCTVSGCGSGSLAAVEMTDCANTLASLTEVLGSTGQGWLWLRCDNSRMNMCSINNSNGDGLHITDCEGLAVDQCYTQHNNSEGVLIDGTSSKCSASNCVATRNTAEGFETAPGSGSCVFDGCTSAFNGGAGIDLDGTENIADGCVIMDNVGAGFFGGSACKITNCYIARNGGQGLSVGDDENSVIDGNTIIDNVSHGIEMGDFNQNVTGNSVRGNGGHGILMNAGSLNCVVTGNRCTLNASNGINISSGATDCLVVDNQLAGNTGAPIAGTGTNCRTYIKRSSYYADTLLPPNNSDWVITPAAGLGADSNDAAFRSRFFDDASETGVGLEEEAPPVIHQLVLRLKTHPNVAPGGAVNAIMNVYIREMDAGIAVGAWSGATALAAIPFTTNEFPVFSTFEIELSTLSIEPGKLYLIEVTRDGADVGDTLSGDLELTQLIVEWR